MKEALDNAIQELKRVDHLFYVSLKYTRTVDVMRHMIERLINAFSYGIESLLKHAKENKKIDEIPISTGMRCKLLLRIFADMELAEHMSLYLKLRKIMRSSYTKREEYRRHVTMISVMDDGDAFEINIDVLKDYYEKAENFIGFAKKIIEGGEEA